MKKSFSQMQGNVLELQVLDVIGPDYWGGVNAQAVIDLVNGHEFESINMIINSPGGDTYEAFAIYNYLSKIDKPIRSEIIGIAASAASLIALAGNEVVMHPSSQYMIHNPWTIAVGDEKEMESTARFLKKAKDSILTIYTKKTGKSSAEVSKLMDDETYFTAQEALDAGFIDSIENSKSGSGDDPSNDPDPNPAAKNKKQREMLSKLKLRINKSSLEQSRLRSQKLKV